MNRQRPYRRSPALDTQEDHYRKQALRSDLSMLQQQNAILKLKCKKVSQLQDKVEMVLKQNAQLLSENEKLSRFLHQQKSDNQVVRNKCETLANQKVAIMGEFELERKKMLRELEQLSDRLSEEEALKNAQVNEMRGQYQQELQSLRKQAQNSENTYEQQIRKLKDQLDKKEHDVNEYTNRLKRVTNESDYEIIRLKDQREKLRSDLVYLQADHIKEVQTLKSKFQTAFQDQVESLKRTHLNNLEEAQLENARLKEGLEEQIRENETLVNKFNKQRTYYQDSISYLKRDCEALRSKVVETKQLGELQCNQLRQKMRQYHQSDLDELQEKQAMQLRAYEEEIHRLESINHGKNVEIEQLIKDKVATRGIFDSQLLRVRDQYATLLQRHKDLQLRHGDLTSQSNNRLADRQKHIEYLQEVIRTQKANHESQSLALQKLVESLKQELANQKLVFRENEQHLKEEIAQISHQLSQAKAKAQLQKADYERQISDLKNQLSGTSHNLSSRADALNNKNRMIEKENQGLKNNITMKEKEIRNLVERLKASSQRETKLQAEIDELRTKMVKREQRANDSIGEQKNRLEASFNYALENLKSDHETALKLQANRYKDLQEKLKRKQAELQQLLRMYKKMTEEIQSLTEQQANKKDLTLKFPGATADLIATKNLFDVYLKTKVLEVCGDALKENKP